MGAEAKTFRDMINLHIKIDTKAKGLVDILSFNVAIE